MWLAVVATLIFVFGCGDDCLPVELTAAEGAVVNISNLRESSVLEATLTADGEPLAHREIQFRVTYRGGDALLGEDDTDEDGETAYAVWPNPTLGFLRAITGAEFVAVFDGDATYCSARDSAPLRLIRRD